MIQHPAYIEIKKACLQERDWFVGKLKEYVLMESPSDNPALNRQLLSVMRDDFMELGFQAELHPSEVSGGQLSGTLESGGENGKQLLVGHADTVWPVGTLEEMPWSYDGKVICGPGVYDMKSGIVMMQTAFRVLKRLNLKPALDPLVLITSDEEIGSGDSRDLVEEFAQQVNRVYVPEPSLGPEGRLKTRRRGRGLYHITIDGKAAHSGLEPEKGASAILEMSYLVQKLFELNKPHKNISVNVGKISGGTAANMIAAKSTALMEVRVQTPEDAEFVEKEIHSAGGELDGTRISVEGGFQRPPMVRNSRNRKLWKVAEYCARQLGLEVGEGTSGGGSDGSFTSQYTATLDGLGPVGEGAHSRSEKIVVDKTMERCALLASMLLAPDVSRVKSVPDALDRFTMNIDPKTG